MANKHYGLIELRFSVFNTTYTKPREDERPERNKITYIMYMPANSSMHIHCQLREEMYRFVANRQNSN